MPLACLARVCVCVCVCVRARACVCVCVCVCSPHITMAHSRSTSRRRISSGVMRSSPLVGVVASVSGAPPCPLCVCCTQFFGRCRRLSQFCRQSTSSAFVVLRQSAASTARLAEAAAATAEADGSGGDGVDRRWRRRRRWPVAVMAMVVAVTVGGSEGGGGGSR